MPSHPILTCTAARAWEISRLANEEAEWAAMQRAGASLARAIEGDFREIGGLPANAHILVLAGKGHNGGDALLAARSLLAARPAAIVETMFAFDAGELRPLARRAWQALLETAGTRVQPFNPGQGMERSFDLCLDGVFGMQFHLPLEEPAAKLLAWVNTHPRIRFRAAVDLPSGLGEKNAGTVFRADFTYATGIVKSPVVFEANSAFVGRLRYLDLGFFAANAPESVERVLTTQILAPLAGLRPAQSDKRTFGHLFVLGGSHSYPGAVVMAVRAALHSGVGLVTAFVPEELVPEYAAQHPEAMWVACPKDKSATLALVRERLARANAFLIGPGLGAEPATICLVQEIVAAAQVPLVLDADALRPEVLQAAGAKPLIATPHAGEYARIAPALPAAVQGVVIRKGPLTRVTAGGTDYYSPFGGPVLARGGSGDLLAGLVGGLLAQKPGDPLLAACRGVVWHGRAADLLARTHGQVAVETTQLLEQLGPALNSHP